MGQEARLSYGGHHVATLFSPTNISGQAAIRGGQLIVGCPLRTHAPKPNTWCRVIDAHARLLLEPGSRLVTQSFLLNSVDAACQEKDEDHGEVTLAFHLDADLVRALDQCRTHGRDHELDFKLWGSVTLSGPGGPKPIQAILQFSMTKSDWHRVVKEMKYGSFATFESPIEGSALPPSLTTAGAHLRTAIQLLRDGNWKNAVSECREVFEKIETLGVAAGPQRADWADKNLRENWDLRTRIAFVRQAIRHLTNVAHHGAAGTSPDEARFAVFATGAIVAIYARELAQ
jgi:hypothetical protein